MYISTTEMHFHFVLFFFVVKIACIYNKESECGCGVSRSLSGNKLYGNFANVFQVKEDDYCPLRLSDNDEHSDVVNRMVLVPAGSYQSGTDDVEIEDDREGPKKIVNLKSFYLDKYEVSNREFARFASSTNYKTEAESFGDSFVFSLFLNSTFKEQLQDYRVVQALWWYKVFGADWRHPYGPDSDVTGTTS